MITLKEWMELVEYRITEGSDYCWNCYGPNAYTLDSWNGDHDGYSMSITFDTKDQTVYETTVCDYSRQRAYRLINPEFKSANENEANSKDVDFKEAWDNVNYVDLDIDDDFIQKALAIRAGEDYDTRVDVPLVLEDDQLFELMKLAHEKDVTLNTLVEEMLQTFIALHGDNALPNKKKKKHKN